MQIVRRGLFKDHGDKVLLDKEDVTIAVSVSSPEELSAATFEARRSSGIHSYSGPSYIYTVKLTAEELITAFLSLRPSDVAQYMASEAAQELSTVCIANLVRELIAGIHTQPGAQADVA